MLTILKYSHHFALESPNDRYITAIEAYTKHNLLSIKYTKLWNGRVIKKLDKVFAVRTKRPLIYRFHINCLQEFLDWMKSHGYNDFRIITQEMFEPAISEFKIITDKTPWGIQPEIISYLVEPGDKKIIELQAGQGKANRHGTPVRTLNGWTNIEDLKVGDKVMGETGEFHNVTGVYPQGLKDIYRFTFRDGRTIDVCKEHLWYVKYCPKGTGFYIRKGVLSTADLLEFQENLKTGLSRFYIPLIDNNVYEPNVDLPIDPYLLGVMLGDGNIRDGRIVITKPLEELHDTISEILDREGVTHRKQVTFRQVKMFSRGIHEQKIIRTVINRTTDNIANIRFFDKLEQMGLLGTVSTSKFIPDVYMTAGTEQRLELIRGLMDTDGHPKMHGGVEVGFTSEKMSNQTRELLFSLGCSVMIRVKKTRYSYKGESRRGQDFYRMSVRSRNASELFKIPSKRDKAFTRTQYSDDFHLRIERIEKLPEQDYATCISVDNPTRLYIAKDYIVTHNTLCTLFAIAQIKQRTVLCIKPMYIQRWMDDLASKKGIFNLKPHELCKVQGTMELASIIRMGLDGNLDYKFIIISNKTLHIYYKEYLNGENMDKYHGVKPFDLFKVLRAGVRVIDEAHQDFHQCFKTDLFTHIPKTIELSATLVPDDPFLRKMYETVYPKEKRFGGGIYRKYVNVVSVPYRLDKNNPSRISTTQKTMTAYSQSAYEESIMKDKTRLTNYLDMIENLTKEYWTTKRVDNYKLLIFASRVEMCRLIVERLETVYNTLKITKYTEEEDYKILPTMDIVVSTPISAGTAVDIPNLQVCINTVALGATQANLQMIGRLRELRGTDVKPTFVYLYCTDIDKHIEYHVKKKDFIFKDRVLEYTDILYESKI